MLNLGDEYMSVQVLKRSQSFILNHFVIVTVEQESGRRI